MSNQPMMAVIYEHNFYSEAWPYLINSTGKYNAPSAMLGKMSVYGQSYKGSKTHNKQTL